MTDPHVPDWALEQASQCWCEPTTSHIVMESALAEVFAAALRDAYDRGAERERETFDRIFGGEHYDRAFSAGREAGIEEAAARAQQSACVCKALKVHPERRPGLKFGIEEGRHLSDCPNQVVTDIRALKEKK